MAGVRGVLHGQLHVGAIQTLGVVDLAGLLACFRRAHPGVTIRLSHGAASALARAAADAELDIAFIDGPADPARLTRTELGRDYLVLAVPRGDPLARRDSIRLDDPVLRERDFVEYRADSALRAQIDAACAAAGLARRIACEVENMQYLVESVHRGLGVTVLPPMAIQAAGGHVAAVPITPPLRRDLSAVVAAGRPATAAAQALLALLAAGAASPDSASPDLSQPGFSQPRDMSIPAASSSSIAPLNRPYCAVEQTRFRVRPCADGLARTTPGCHQLPCAGCTSRTAVGCWSLCWLRPGSRGSRGHGGDPGLIRIGGTCPGPGPLLGLPGWG